MKPTDVYPQDVLEIPDHKKVVGFRLVLPEDIFIDLDGQLKSGLQDNHPQFPKLIVANAPFNLLRGRKIE